MTFGGWKGELLVVIGCGTNRLDSAKLVSTLREFGIRYNAFLSKIRKNTTGYLTN